MAKHRISFLAEEIDVILKKAKEMEEYDDSEIKQSIEEIESNLHLIRTELNNYSKETTINKITDNTNELLFEYLPDNNNEFRFLNPVSAINFVNLTELNNEISENYWCLFVIKKQEEISGIEEIISDSRIKFMNIDLDLSEYQTIHLLFTYDGENICCSIMGY